MTIGYLVALRNNMLDEIAALVDAGATGGLLRGYDGTRPATGGTATTLLFECTFSVTAFGVAVAGVLTANAITDDSSANATGTCTWFRVLDSDSTFVYDGDAAASGADLNLSPSAVITSGQPVAISSLTITEGNP